MKLRFVEREIQVPAQVYGPNITVGRVVKILQYLDNGDEWNKPKWVDVPLEKEE